MCTQQLGRRQSTRYQSLELNKFIVKTTSHCLMTRLPSSATVVSLRSTHPYFRSNFLYKVKVYLNEHPPWRELCATNQSALMECWEAQCQCACCSNSCDIGAETATCYKLKCNSASGLLKVQGIFWSTLCISEVRKLRVTLYWRMVFWQSQLMGRHSLAKPRLRWRFAVQSVVCSQNVSFQGLRLFVCYRLSNTSANLWAMSHCKHTRVVKCGNTWKNAHLFLWQACKVLCPWVLFRETTVYIYSLRLHCSRYVCNH